MGPFTGLKALAGQHATELGDVRLTRWTPVTFDGAVGAYRSVVTQASHLANEFAGQSQLTARLRASFPILADTMINSTLAMTAGYFGLQEAHISASGLHPKLTPAVPPTGQGTPPIK